MNRTSDDETEDEPSQEIHDGKETKQNEKQIDTTLQQLPTGPMVPTQQSIPDWVKTGVKCMALYKGDNLFYRAVIKSIHKDDNGNHTEVTFIGFETEGEEFVEIQNLKRIPHNKIFATKTPKESIEEEKETSYNSFFSHLQGCEQIEQLRAKYGDEDVDEQDYGDSLMTQIKQNGLKRKGVLDVCAHTTNKNKGKRTRKRKKLKKQKPFASDLECDDIETMKSDTDNKRITADNHQDNTNDLKPSEDDWDSMEGFNDQDMEKPHFSEPAPHPLVPLVLSEPTQQQITQIPALINCRLREYQRDGVRFLYQHYHDNTGAILGDDMGLGKTVQVIAFLAAMLGKTGTKIDVYGKYMKQDSKDNECISKAEGCFLIVSPSSVLYNWRDELDTWGHFKVRLYHGTKKEGVLELAAKGKLDVVLTTYDTMKLNLKKFNRVNWLAVIMDEAHKLKDPASQITMAAKALNVKRRYGLTGTPLQNRFAEFWCVLDWANPGCLGSAKKFVKQYSKPIKKGQRYEVTKRELAIGRTMSKKLQTQISQWFLRRTKDLIADQLPNKDEKVVFCNLTSLQEDVYVTLLQSPDVKLITKKDFPCDCGSGTTRGKCCYTSDESGEPVRSILMRYLQLLLKAANHTALLMPQIEQTNDQRIKAKTICDKVFSRHPEFSAALAESSFQTLSDPSYCGKMKVLDQLLRMYEKEKSKVLLFSQSTQLLNILEEYVIGRGMVYSRLDGKTKTSQRALVVREFNTNPEIFICLVSTRAGALGLNFTGANIVIIFDPTWNPANDLQAQDRAYRIGQRRDVQVFRLISSGTIEEMMYLRQIYKQQIANIAVKGSSERRYFTGVEGEKDLKGELFGIENLFSYRAEGASLAHDIIRRTDRLEAGLRVEKYKIVGVNQESEDEYGTNTHAVDDGNDGVDGYDLETVASQYFDEEAPDGNTDLDKASTSGMAHRHDEKCYAPNENTDLDKASTSGMTYRHDENSDSEDAEQFDKKLQRKNIKLLTTSESSQNDSSLEDVDNNKKKTRAVGVMKHTSSQRLKTYLSEFFSSFDNESSEGNYSSSSVKSDRKSLGRQNTENDAIDVASCEEVRQKGRKLQGRRFERVREGVESTDTDEAKCGQTDSEQEQSFLNQSDSIQRFTKIKSKKQINKTGCKNMDPVETSGQEKHDVTQSVKIPSRGRLESKSVGNVGRTAGLSNQDRAGSKLERCTDGVYLSMSSEGEPENVVDVVCPSKRRISKRRRHGKITRVVRTRVTKNVIQKEKNRTLAEGGKENSKEKVEQLLSKCGVSYTHANRSVVRTSKAESHMTKRAIQDVFEFHQHSQQPANCFAAFEVSDESDDVAEHTTRRPEVPNNKKNKKTHDNKTANQTTQVATANRFGDFSANTSRFAETGQTAGRKACDNLSRGKGKGRAFLIRYKRKGVVFDSDEDEPQVSQEKRKCKLKKKTSIRESDDNCHDNRNDDDGHDGDNENNGDEDGGDDNDGGGGDNDGKNDSNDGNDDNGDGDDNRAGIVSVDDSSDVIIGINQSPIPTPQHASSPLDHTNTTTSAHENLPQSSILDEFFPPGRIKHKPKARRECQSKSQARDSEKASSHISTAKEPNKLSELSPNRQENKSILDDFI